MTPRELIEFLRTAEKLKCNTRHSWTSDGRRESVAEHSWQLSLMAMLMKESYPALNIDKVIQMCLIHDLGEAVTGDIPAFEKTAQHEQTEDDALDALIGSLPTAEGAVFRDLFAEMRAMETPEAKLYKCLDNCEALIQHNEADLSTWLPLEHEANLVYGKERCDAHPYTKALHAEIVADSLKKLNQE